MIIIFKLKKILIIYLLLLISILYLLLFFRLLNSQNLIERSGIPFGFHFTPFCNKKDNNLKKYTFGNGNAPISICKCGTFINPYSPIINGSWKCNICNQINTYDPSVEDSIMQIIKNNEDIYEIYANSEYILYIMF